MSRAPNHRVAGIARLDGTRFGAFAECLADKRSRLHTPHVYDACPIAGRPTGDGLWMVMAQTGGAREMVRGNWAVLLARLRGDLSRLRFIEHWRAGSIPHFSVARLARCA